MNDKVVLEVRRIVKDFPGLRANDNISFQLHEGEILTLLGENGAGKTTLMNIIMGIYKPDAGEILVNGEPVHISDPREANRLGIGMVHQHFKLVHNFTVAENIVLGAEPGNGLKLNMKQAVRRVQELSERYGLAIDPNARTDKITVGMQQRTEILKMLYRDANILIFDEPTAVLMPQEIEVLIAIMRSHHPHYPQAQGDRAGRRPLRDHPARPACRHSQRRRYHHAGNGRQNGGPRGTLQHRQAAPDAG